MGTQQSSPAEIQKFWQETTLRLMDIPGQPQLVQSLRRPTLEAERYIIQMINTNQQQQASIFRERKISHQNIVNVYDFEINKGLLGCARNAHCYDIITERIKYRLSRFNSLTSSQMIYIFHQCLCGYGQLSQYDKICYPNANTIGIKQNGEIKVWLNQNWSDNTYRQCRFKSMSIDALWNCIKMCGDSRTLAHFNQAYYKIDRVSFDNVIDLIRGNFAKEVVEGRFALESRIKMVQGQQENLVKIKNNTNQEQIDRLDATRPRAVSEQLRKNINNFVPPQPIHFINRNIEHIAYQAQNNPYINISMSEPLYKQAESNLLNKKTSLKNNMNIEKPLSSYPYRQVSEYQKISSSPMVYQIENLYLSTANRIDSRLPILKQSHSQAYKLQEQTPTQIIFNNTVRPISQQEQNLTKKPNSITPNHSPPPLQYISKSLDNSHNTHLRYDHTPPLQKKLFRQNQNYEKDRLHIQNNQHNINTNHHNIVNNLSKPNQFPSNIQSSNNYATKNFSNYNTIQFPSRQIRMNIKNSITEENKKSNQQDISANLNNIPNISNISNIQHNRYYSTNTHNNSHNNKLNNNINSINEIYSHDYNKKKIVSFNNVSHTGPNNFHRFNNLSHTTNTYHHNHNHNHHNHNHHNHNHHNSHGHNNQSNSMNNTNNIWYSYKNSEYVPDNLQQVVAMKLDIPQNKTKNYNTTSNYQSNQNNYSNIKFRQTNKQYQNLHTLTSTQYHNIQQNTPQVKSRQPEYLTNSPPITISNNQLQLNLQKLQTYQHKQDYSTERPMNNIYSIENYIPTNRNNSNSSNSTHNPHPNTINLSSYNPINNNSNNTSGTNSQITRYQFKSERQTMQQKQKNNQYIRQMQTIQLHQPVTHQLFNHEYQNIHNFPTSPPTQPYIFQSPIKSNKKKVLQIYPQIQIHNYSTISEKEMSMEQVSELNDSSDSKKVAEEFKYYLRSIQRSPKKNQQNQQNQQNYQEYDGISDNRAENRNNSKYNTAYQPPSEKRARNLYDASIIPQRWEQQQSFSQVL